MADEAPRKHVIKVDGKEREFTDEELRAYASKGVDYETKMAGLKQEKDKLAQWNDFSNWFNQDPAAASKWLAEQHGGASASTTPPGPKVGSDEALDDGYEESPRERKLREEMEATKRKLGQFENLLGGIVMSKSEESVSRVYGKDLTQEEVQSGLQRAKQLMRMRPGLALEDAFPLANREAIEQGITRRLRRELSPESDQGPEEPPAPEEPTRPPVLGDETRGGRGTRKDSVKITEAERHYLASMGWTEEEYRESLRKDKAKV